MVKPDLDHSLLIWSVQWLIASMAFHIPFTAKEVTSHALKIGIFVCYKCSKWIRYLKALNHIIDPNFVVVATPYSLRIQIFLKVELEKLSYIQYSISDGCRQGVSTAELFALIAIYIIHYSFNLVVAVRAFSYMKPFA